MLNTKQRSRLKSLAVKLKPTVNIGKGDLSETMLREIETALYHNELVKVNVLKSCDAAASELLAVCCEKLDAEPVLAIGKRFVLYKKTDKKDFEHILVI